MQVGGITMTSVSSLNAASHLAVGSKSAPGPFPQCRPVQPQRTGQPIEMRGQASLTIQPSSMHPRPLPRYGPWGAFWVEASFGNLDVSAARLCPVGRERLMNDAIFGQSPHARLQWRHSDGGLAAEGWVFAGDAPDSSPFGMEVLGKCDCCLGEKSDRDAGPSRTGRSKAVVRETAP
jgi:hypothetical protein